MDILNQPNDLSLWAALVGMGLPFLVGLLQHWKWPSWVNAVVFAIACFVAAAVTEWVRNGTDWNATGYFHTFLVIAVAAIALYHLYWNRKSSGGDSLVDKARKFGTLPPSVHPNHKKPH